MLLARCPWAEGSALEAEYHDREWGAPVHDDRVLFEFLVLEGAQAGLSWRTILAKREGYRAAFLDYDLERLARLDDEALEQRLLDPGIVRNRLKVWSVRSNARAALDAIAAAGSLDALLWSFVDGVPIQPITTGPGCRASFLGEKNSVSIGPGILSTRRQCRRAYSSSR